MVLGGTIYAHTICFCQVNNNYGGSLTFAGDYHQYTFVYDLGGKYKTFDATIGLVDGNDVDSKEVVLFTVQVDNDAPVYSGSATIYTPHKVHVSVSGGIRLTLTMQGISGTDQTTSLAAPAWGDARLQ